MEVEGIFKTEVSENDYNWIWGCLHTEMQVSHIKKSDDSKLI